MPLQAGNKSVTRAFYMICTIILLPLVGMNKILAPMIFHLLVSVWSKIEIFFNLHNFSIIKYAAAF